MQTELSPPGAAAVAPQSIWTQWWMGFWRVLVLNTMIALTLWAAGTGPLAGQMVYSQAIGLSIWVLIQLSLRVRSEPNVNTFRRGPMTYLIVAGAIVVGWLFGTGVGNWYVGESGLALMQASPRLIGSLFLMTACIGVLATYHFYVEGRGMDLARDLEVSRRQTAEAQLMLLQSQLEPHMLFNTLANLRVLVATDTPKALFMLDRFNDFLRSTLSASRAPAHALQQEFDRLSDYLALMGLRLGNRLQTELSLPDDLAQCRIPTLLLQPLVENALVHGLEPVVGGGKIWVRASRQAQQLLIEVGDTGAGCTQPDPQHCGFGLTQVRERLQTAYGAGANLQLLPNEPRGTLVRITLPLTQ